MRLYETKVKYVVLKNFYHPAFILIVAVCIWQLLIKPENLMLYNSWKSATTSQQHSSPALVARKRLRLNYHISDVIFFCCLNKFWPLRLLMHKVKAPFASLLLLRGSRCVTPLQHAVNRSFLQHSGESCPPSEKRPLWVCHWGILPFGASASLLFCLRWNRHCSRDTRKLGKGALLH